MVTGTDWPMITLAVTVALAVFAAGWAAVSRRMPRPVLPYRHVAGAAIVGLIGWEAVVNLPSAVLGYFAFTAGIGDVPGVEIDVAFVAAQIVFAIGTAFAVVGILLRRTWGVVLGIGLAAARLATALAIVAQMVVLSADVQVIGDTSYAFIIATTLALMAVPPIVAIILLAWPMIERRAAPEPAAPEPDWNARTTPAGPAR